MNLFCTVEMKLKPKEFEQAVEDFLFYTSDLI